MLPNSRMIPTKNQRRRSNSASVVPTMYEPHQQQQKRGFISRFLNTKEYNTQQRPKYESILGIQNDKDYATWGGKPSGLDTNLITTSSSIKSSSSTSSTGSGGFTKLFKKRGGKSVPTLDEEDNYNDLPQVRPVHSNIKHSKIPLAPPPILKPTHVNGAQFLNNLPDQYIAKRPVSSAPPPQTSISRPPPAQNNISRPPSSLKQNDNNSLRKSSGSYSIYSTFGGSGSVYSEDGEIKKKESQDSFTTVVTTVTTPTPDEDDDEEETEEDSEDEDAFVDATGFSQEDIEKERNSLSKRLSGGHFGSAGGLVLSLDQEPPPVPSTQHNKDDELAQSMLNWKRHSGGNKRFSIRSGDQQQRASTITMIDLRIAEYAAAEEELSVSDKMALRKEAEEALSGVPPPSPPTIVIEEESSAAQLFSKTLNDVWQNDTVQLFDERTKQIQESIQDGQGDKIEENIKETALLLWKEDESVVSKEKMAEWLGTAKPFNTAVLHHYMQYFYFAEMRLDSAFRKLCSKLYFKAEAQQIDRILESFANRYWDCNKDCLLGSADVVYAVVYSLLLLNTDLHVAQGNHARMTRSEFIRNTMSTVRDQRDHEEEQLGNMILSPIQRRQWETDVEAYMKEMYMSVKNYQILQPLERKTSLSKRGSLMASRRVIGLKNSVNSIIRKSGRESMLVFDSEPPVSPSSLSPPPRSSMSSGYNRPMTPSSIKSPRRESFSSNTSSSAASNSSSRCTSPQQQQQPMIQYMDTHANSLFSSRPPYFKEGVVMRKHLLENASQKARHREWRECFLEVGQDGELKMYALQQPASNSNDKRMFRHSTAFVNNPLISEKVMKPSFSFHGHTKWSASSQLIGKISLNHTLSNPLPPPGYNRQRPHVFALQQSDGGVYLFQAASAEQTQEWVSTCNYWAARESKEPLPGGVGNMEYGWGACLKDVILDLDAMRKGYDQKQYINLNNSDPDAVMIQDWIPPTATMVSSQLDEKEQYEMLQRHLNDLNNEINIHRDMKAKVLIKFPSKCNNYHKVMTNWEARSKYLLHDIIKYQNYCDALEKSQAIIMPATTVKQEELTLKTTQVDLFNEINQELFLGII